MPNISILGAHVRRDTKLGGAKAHSVLVQTSILKSHVHQVQLHAYACFQELRSNQYDRDGVERRARHCDYLVTCFEHYTNSFTQVTYGKAHMHRKVVEDEFRASAIADDDIRTC